MSNGKSSSEIQEQRLSFAILVLVLSRGSVFLEPVFLEFLYRRPGSTHSSCVAPLTQLNSSTID